MTTKVKANGRAGEMTEKVTASPAPDRYVARHDLLMELPDPLPLNFDTVSADDYFLFADPDTNLQWRRAFMDSILVGGLGQYHALLIPRLSVIIVEQLAGFIGAGKKKPN